MSSSRLPDMGNTQTPDGAEHDLYRRPVDGVEPEGERQPSVQIVETGSGPDAGAVRGSAGTDAGTRKTAGPRQMEPAETPLDHLPLWRRANVALAAA